MKVVFFGTPVVAIHILMALTEGGHDVVGIVTQPASTTTGAGKGKDRKLFQFAVENGIPCLQPESLSAPEIRPRIEKLRGEIAVVAAYGNIIPKNILEIWEKGCICVHPSLLPKNRGASPVQETILKGDTLTGTTIFSTVEKMDAGPVLSQEQIVLSENETGESLLERLFLLGGEMICPTLKSYDNGTLTPIPQDHSEATFTSLLKKEDGEINWNEASDIISRRVRAYVPWPGTFTFWNGKRLAIISTKLINYDGDYIPGRVIDFDDKTKTIIIATGKSKLGISRLQLEGKRVITAAEFLRGYPSFIGANLPS